MWRLASSPSIRAKVTCLLSTDTVKPVLYVLELTPVVWVCLASTLFDAMRCSQFSKSRFDKVMPLTDSAVLVVAPQADSTVASARTSAARARGIERRRVTARSA